MKRSAVLVALLALSALAISAQPMAPFPAGPRPFHPGQPGGYERKEMEALRAELGEKTLGEIGGAELESWAGRLGEAAAKDRWILASARASMMFPGAGQFMNGDGLGGGLLAAAHLATLAGTAAAWYFLLPSELNFEGLDYYRSDFAAIKSRWEGASLEELLPSFGAAAGGMALDMVWRMWSARSAFSQARAAVEAGRVELKPFGMPGGMGLMLRY
jgi:hypothetical protein